MKKKRESGDELRQQLNKIMTMPEGADWPLVSRVMSALGVALGDYTPFVDYVRKGTWCDKPDPKMAIKRSVFWSTWRLDRGLDRALDRGPRKEITGYFNGQTDIDRFDVAALKLVREPEREERPLGVIAKCLPAQYVIPRPLSQDEKVRLARIIRADAGYPDGWDHEGPIDRGVIPDWDKIAAAAGLDRWECRAVVYRATGISREHALGKRSGSSRRRLQNAYKRIQRGKWDKVKRFVHNLIAQEHDRRFPAALTFTPEDVDIHTGPDGPKVYTLREASSEFRRGEPIIERWVDAGMLPTRGSGDDSKPLFTKEDLDRFKQERQPFVRAPIRPK